LFALFCAPFAHTQKLKKSEIENIRKEFLLLEESLTKTRHALASGKGKHDDNTLETAVENISAALSKIAEKRRTQVNRYVILRDLKIITFQCNIDFCLLHRLSLCNKEHNKLRCQ
jgi:hypothetical protein